MSNYKGDFFGSKDLTSQKDKNKYNTIIIIKHGHCYLLKVIYRSKVSELPISILCQESVYDTE